MTKEITTKNPITKKHIFAAEIMKAFVLKCIAMDDVTIKAFAAEAVNDGFLPSEISQACYDVSRDAGLRKIIYADIYEKAKGLREERRKKERAAMEQMENDRKGFEEKAKIAAIKMTKEEEAKVRKWAKDKGYDMSDEELKGTYFYLKETNQI